MHFSDYELIQHLGVSPGRRNELWLAEKQGDGVARKVVLARLDREASADPASVEAFIEATRREAALDHAHIARVFDIGYADGQFYYCRSWVDGMSLRQLRIRLASRDQVMPLEHALFIAVRVARAIAAAHGARDRDGKPTPMIHGSLSASQVLVSRTGEVVVTGPWAGDRPDRTSDVQAVAALLFELIAGAPALSQRPRLSAIAPEVPAELDALIERTLVADPARRSGDIDGLARDLAQIAAGFARRSSPEALARWIEGALADRSAIASRRPVRKFREVATEVRPLRVARGSLAPEPSYARLPVVVRPDLRIPTRRSSRARQALILLAVAALMFAASTTITMALL